MYDYLDSIEYNIHKKSKQYVRIQRKSDERAEAGHKLCKYCDLSRANIGDISAVQPLSETPGGTREECVQCDKHLSCKYLQEEPTLKHFRVSSITQHCSERLKTA
ncbi:unnamed protein product [Leptosia nina]|uniref:Uncharacterized protein n=1 Tax=Leptosia nina TaxID=320188 RepID=A0AAV1J9E3_9NEOP